jgi:hypothetical protein
MREGEYPPLHKCLETMQNLPKTPQQIEPQYIGSYHGRYFYTWVSSYLALVDPPLMPTKLEDTIGALVT